MSHHRNDPRDAAFAAGKEKDKHRNRRKHKEFARREKVRRGAGEYAKGDVHTNTIEGFFSIFKRGVIGTYHHVSPQHLKRYLAEFDFRYSNRMALGVDDLTRTHRAIKGAEGKRLMYREAGRKAA